jgi:hypothetical protein
MESGPHPREIDQLTVLLGELLLQRSPRASPRVTRLLLDPIARQVVIASTEPSSFAEGDLLGSQWAALRDPASTEPSGFAEGDLLFAIGATGQTMKSARHGVITEQGQRLLRGTLGKTPAMERACARRRSKVRAWRRRGLAEGAYLVAVSQIGVMEEGGNNTGRRVSEIIRSNGGVVGEPWCGDFAAYCYRLAGSTAVGRPWASVAALRWAAGIVPTTAPARGDLVRFTFDHVGIFVCFVGNGEIETIEGNTGASGAVSDSATGGDGIYRKRRAISLVNDYLHVTR